MNQLPSFGHLSTPEKLALMELLWADLSKTPEEIPSPEWHGDILAERERALVEGKTHFEDWEDVKKRLRERRQ